MKNQKSNSEKVSRAMEALLDKVLKHGADNEVVQAVIRLDKVIGYAR
jgi:hypothetical protein